MLNTLTAELLRMMVGAGLYQITISLDSGSARTLKQLHHKPVDLRRIPELIDTCKSLGVWTHGTLVVGMPGETLEDLTQGLSFVKQNLPFNSISTFIASPIPGSELYHQALEAGLTEASEARRIDTTRSNMKNTEIPASVLETTARRFQQDVTGQIKTSHSWAESN